MGAVAIVISFEILFFPQVMRSDLSVIPELVPCNHTCTHLQTGLVTAYDSGLYCTVGHSTMVHLLSRYVFLSSYVSTQDCSL